MINIIDGLRLTNATTAILAIFPVIVIILALAHMSTRGVIQEGIRRFLLWVFSLKLAALSLNAFLASGLLYNDHLSDIFGPKIWAILLNTRNVLVNVSAFLTSFGALWLIRTIKNSTNNYESGIQNN